MKTGKRKVRLYVTVIISFFTFFAVPENASAQTTAFNFQGRLNDGSSPANGHYDLQFRLFDSITGGTPIGTLDRPNLTLINGIFSTQLDFGAAVFDGGNRFIEIGLRLTTTGSTTPNAYVVLGPRQQILSVPYAIRSLQATTADTAGNANNLGNIAPGGFIQNTTSQQPNANLNISGDGTFGGNVSIGTTTPPSSTKLAVNNPSSTGYAISATSQSSTAISGLSGSGAGLIAGSSSGYGISTSSTTSYGIVATTYGNPNAAVAAVLGQYEGGTNPGYGVYGTSVSSGTAGVYGYTGSGYGVYGKSVSGGVGVYGEYEFPSGGYAGYFAGPVKVDGNVSQTLVSNGLPKAILRLDRDGNITRCYNGVTAASTGNCGFTISHGSLGIYDVALGFSPQNLTITATTEFDGGGTVGLIGSRSASGFSLRVEYNGNGNLTNAPINITIF